MLNSGAPIRSIGLGVTLNVQLSRSDADRLQNTGRPFASYAGRCAHAWIDYLHTEYPGQNLLSAPCTTPWPSPSSANPISSPSNRPGSRSRPAVVSPEESPSPTIDGVLSVVSAQSMKRPVKP